MNLATVIDLGACIGCDACALACRAEHNLPPGMDRLHLKIVEQGSFPDVRRAYQVNRCQDCADAPCASICPTRALVRTSSGDLALIADSCVGCRACLAACPYDALSIHPETGVADRCDGCAHRQEQGIEPACAVACPTGAIRLSDLSQPDEPAAVALSRGELRTLRPELGTAPRVYYRGAVPLDPLRARSAGIFAAREQPDPGPVHTGGTELLVAGGHVRVGLDVRTALMTWTQSLSAGVYLVPALGVALGLLPDDQLIWRIVAPVIGLLYLAGSAAAISWTSGRRGKLHLIFRTPNPSSWLARGAWAGLFLGAIMTLQVLSTLAGLPLDRLLLVPGLLAAFLLPAHAPLALRQCRGRTLWQPLRGIPRAIFGSIMLGGAMLLPFVASITPKHEAYFAATTALGALGWLATVALDLFLEPASASARAASHELRLGAWRWSAWGGASLGLVGLTAIWLGPWVTLPILAAPLLFAHAIIGAGQSAPQA